jgi:hypothetical protein
MTVPGSEALLAAGYAVFLLAGAYGLDVMARHTHRRSDRYATAGFTYHPHLDAWECPTGEHLRRVELDHDRRLVRYRGAASVCNACPMKDSCTDSDEGREIAQALDPWPHSEAGRFHRGICVAMIALAVLVAILGVVRNNQPAELLLLLAVLGASIVALLRAAEGFRATPSGFPASSGPST